MSQKYEPKGYNNVNVERNFLVHMYIDFDMKFKI